MKSLKKPLTESRPTEVIRNDNLIIRMLNYSIIVSIINNPHS